MTRTVTCSFSVQAASMTGAAQRSGNLGAVEQRGLFAGHSPNSDDLDLLLSRCTSGLLQLLGRRSQLFHDLSGLCHGGLGLLGADGYTVKTGGLNGNIRLDLVSNGLAGSCGKCSSTHAQDQCTRQNNTCDTFHDDNSFQISTTPQSNVALS